MKICVTAEGDRLESLLDDKFGRASYFIILDTENMDFKPIKNKGTEAKSGAGVCSAQTMIDEEVAAIITGNVGPKANTVLKSANIEVYKGVSGSVEENVEHLKKDSLEKIDTAAPSHFGMRGKHR